MKDERLWHKHDHLYDLVIVIGYNDSYVIDGAGSAIFLHVARPDYAPSTGCASVALNDMMAIIPFLGTDSTLAFSPETLKDEPIKWPSNPPS